MRQKHSPIGLAPFDYASSVFAIGLRKSSRLRQVTSRVKSAKYHYNFWRPVTAIRNGDIDDNPNTERDATWQPIDNTPMHPEYPCAHCIMSATIASVVEQLFGTADVPEVTLTSPTAPGVTHRWTNMWRLAEEASQARIWAGFHYRFSTMVGQDIGRKIGQYVVNNAMQPANMTSAR